MVPAIFLPRPTSPHSSDDETTSDVSRLVSRARAPPPRSGWRAEQNNRPRHLSQYIYIPRRPSGGGTTCVRFSFLFFFFFFLLVRFESSCSHTARRRGICHPRHNALWRGASRRQGSRCCLDRVEAPPPSVGFCGTGIRYRLKSPVWWYLYLLYWTAQLAEWRDSTWRIASNIYFAPSLGGARMRHPQGPLAAGRAALHGHITIGAETRLKPVSTPT